MVKISGWRWRMMFRRAGGQPGRGAWNGPRALGLAAMAAVLAALSACTMPTEERRNALKEGRYLDETAREVAQLARGKENKLQPFTPRVWSGKYFAKRHTPIVYTSAPWEQRNQSWIEVPEYVWGTVPGDAHNWSPFFYGRDQEMNKEWGVRYPSKTPPEWKEMEGGGLALDNELEGGYVMRFRVIPWDRMIEVRFGITNGSAQRLMDIRCQLCMMPHMIRCLSERWPTFSKMLVDGKVVSWDAAGQDISWINPYRKADGSFTQSCYFMAPVKGHVPGDWASRNRRQEDVMWLDAVADIPAIAKSDQSGSRLLVVYSPFSQTVFYNCLVPCFHADPQMRGIMPGETRWTSNYYVFFEGKAEDLFERLAALHEKRKQENGVLSEPGV